ncbi:MAG: RdgB/HAM1 family non-canonical purine NTP pyrophosphatase [Merdibacter sp.]|nr:RdgB/HAM1 family non-canonical purine NTP pyrophosphatase [Merdibacter sp.]
MKEIMIATSNAHKVEEFREMLEPLGIQVRSLLDLEEKVEIEETGTTFAENAMIKALSVHERLGIPVISDDSGLEVDAMDKAPGVYSARFLGYDTPYEEKNQYIMDQVKGKTRTARYVCAIAYVEEDGAGHVFTGVVEGEIADHARGEKGFGYDPIFYYPPYGATLAEVSEEKKNAISHRGRALAQLIAYMKEAER